MTTTQTYDADDVFISKLDSAGNKFINHHRSKSNYKGFVPVCNDLFDQSTDNKEEFISIIDSQVEYITGSTKGDDVCDDKEKDLNNEGLNDGSVVDGKVVQSKSMNDASVFKTRLGIDKRLELLNNQSAMCQF